jgi:hypothetical protein
MKIAVIDMDSVCYSIGHPNKVLDEFGTPVRENNKFVYYEKTDAELVVAADQVMNSILQNSGATHYIAYMKGQETIVSRKAINPDYKANRSKEAPWWWKQVQVDLFLRWEAKYVHDLEVDDAVNITRLKLPDSFICAIDNDLLGLKGTHYNWRKDEWVKVTEAEANNKFWTDMIAGQTGDNIKGIPGKGIKYAEKLFADPTYYDMIFTYPELTFRAYLDHFGTHLGIKEYYKNYMSLKILEDFEYFDIPQPIEVKKENLFEKA